MLQLNVTTQFRKDYKKLKKQGKDLALLEAIIDKLLAAAMQNCSKCKDSYAVFDRRNTHQE